MGVLFDKDVVDETKLKKPFVIVLEKYKQPVIINNIEVSEGDDMLLTIDYDHNIEDVPDGEIGEELGRVVLEMIEKGLEIDTSDMTIEKE